MITTLPRKGCQEKKYNQMTSTTIKKEINKLTAISMEKSSKGKHDTGLYS